MLLGQNISLLSSWYPELIENNRRWVICSPECLEMVAAECHFSIVNTKLH